MADQQYVDAMAALTAARTEQMLSTGKATRPAQPGQTPELDDDGNVTAPADTVIHASVPCTISDPTAAQRGQRSSNDQAGVPDERVLKTPHDIALRPGDLFEVLTSPFSPGVVGDVFVVAGELEKSYATSRRYAIRGSSWLSQDAPP